MQMTKKQALNLGYEINRGSHYGSQGGNDQDSAKFWYIEKKDEPQRRFTGYATMAAALGALASRLDHAREAGSVKSATKAATSKLNGARGGRPTNLCD